MYNQIFLFYSFDFWNTDGGTIEYFYEKTNPCLQNYKV